MAIAAIQTILDRIDTWSTEQQERAASLLASMEASHDDEWQVSDEDLAEIGRRLADPDAPSITLEDLGTNSATI